MNITETTLPDTLFYDGSCPLCSKEITWLQRHQKGLLTFQNIHDDELEIPATKKAEMLQKLHLLKGDGSYLTGLDATVGSWKHIPYGWLLSPLRWPVIGKIADYCYTQWAEKRYKKRYECGECSIKE